MTETKKRWTPGQWEVERDYVTSNPHVYGIKGTGGESIARTSPWLVRDDLAESRANAHLISAAPDLYEALQELVDLVKAVREGDYEIDYYTTQPGLKALRKARGEDPTP